MTRVQYIAGQQASSLTLRGPFPFRVTWTHLLLSWTSLHMDGCCIKLACKKILVEPSFSIASDSPVPWIQFYRSILLTRVSQSKDHSTTKVTMKSWVFQKSSTHFSPDILHRGSALLRTVR